MMNRFTIITMLVFALLAAGCPDNSGKPIPADLPPSREVPNPDFVAGSSWFAESATSVLREIHFADKNNVGVRIDSSVAPLSDRLRRLQSGYYKLRLTEPTDGQSLTSGYPIQVNGPIALWF